jgi:tetratricopeptide (TPR) repeat protein
MDQAAPTRRQMLEECVRANPDDAFGRYGLALECVNAGENSAAEGHFRHLLEANPGYVAGYQHYGMLLVRLGRTEDAQNTFRRGITAAKNSGDTHALGELEAALAEISS